MHCGPNDLTGNLVSNIPAVDKTQYWCGGRVSRFLLVSDVSDARSIAPEGLFGEGGDAQTGFSGIN